MIFTLSFRYLGILYHDWVTHEKSVEIGSLKMTISYKAKSVVLPIF